MLVSKWREFRGQRWVRGDRGVVAVDQLLLVVRNFTSHGVVGIRRLAFGVVAASHQQDDRRASSCSQDPSTGWQNGHGHSVSNKGP